jgi:hypothetical protein
MACKQASNILHAAAGNTIANDSGVLDNNNNTSEYPEGYSHNRAKFLAENDELDETNWANFNLHTFNEIKAYNKNQSVVASVKAAITAPALKK